MAPFAACTAALLALASARAAAQDARPIAFTNARLLTMAGEPIEGGTLVVRNGKIEAIGKDAVVPAGARVIDCTDMTIMPGLVSAVSSAGLTQPPYLTGGIPGAPDGRSTTAPDSSN